MLFRKNIEPQCSYCKNGTSLWEGTIGCKKHGVLFDFDCCKRFKYDPYARVPEKPVRIFSSLDSSLIDYTEDEL